MPRSNRPRRSAARRGSGQGSGFRGKDFGGGDPRDISERRESPLFTGNYRVESAKDGEWHVVDIPGFRAMKTYICPGCRRDITPGTPHKVAWRSDHWSGEEKSAAERRHWHVKCWSARGTLF
ncbi:hypothetical protein HD598_002612 [Neomicrococcus aestuarii]|uniref:ATP/GTP-binding protein n=1 Tax=Neomicrococcus aestuarii TaxID=556325 RepID=A0A7W8TXE3_9MICC|nr:hypothetical protein [Neomicrococcus aestuarii]MBB5513925.1 hypothetical protein [Neomicrococcus aestuarii]